MARIWTSRAKGLRPWYGWARLSESLTCVCTHRIASGALTPATVDEATRMAKRISERPRRSGFDLRSIGVQSGNGKEAMDTVGRC